MSGRRIVTRGALAVVVATCVGLEARVASGSPFRWNAQARVEGSHTSSVFPGYFASTPDNFSVGRVDVTGKARLGGDARLQWTTSAAMERYDNWSERDAERYESDVDLKTSRFRARLKGRLEPDVLLYPDGDGGARYRSRQGAIGFEARVFAPLVAGVEVRSESQRYDAVHAGRDCRRARWGYSLTWSPDPVTRLGLAFENERSEADDANYDFRQNELTFSFESRFRLLNVRAEIAPGIRNYFTGSLFASNYRRHDSNQAWRLRLERPVGRGLGLFLLEEFRRRNSTRPGRDFEQNTIGMGLELTLKR